MKVLHIHAREIHQPKEKLMDLLLTLATPADKIWPYEKWPPVVLKNGLKVGSVGGHGPIRYQVTEVDPAGKLTFRFLGPRGFHGTHQFEIIGRGESRSEIRHSIMMNTTWFGTVAWLTVFRWLHDALVEDAFDKLEQQFSPGKKRTEWSVWVKILRRILR